MDQFIAQVQALRNSIPFSTTELSNIKSDYCNWVIPKRLMCGTYPWVDKPYFKHNFPTEFEAISNMKAIIDDGVNTFISLQIEEPEYPRYAPFALTLNSNAQFIHFPLTDNTTPQHSTFVKHLSLILEKLKDGRNIYIHCAGGHGRTGIYIACILMILYGFSAKYAMYYTQHFHNMRRKLDIRCNGEFPCMSPDLDIQREFICDFEKFLKFSGF